MSSDIHNLKQLHDELDQALSLLQNRKTSLAATYSSDKNALAEADSLLARCEAMVSSKNKQKPTIRIIHHLACSGGTLFSKCIAAMPNVFLLSELHPTTTLHMGGGKPKFLPSDIPTQARYAGVPFVDELANKIFLNNINEVYEHVERVGGTLVIRDHSHSDFCVGESPNNSSTIVELLSSKYNVKRLATIRNPIDAYMSLVSNNWEHYTPKGFNEYCRRFLLFISEFKNSDILKYEALTSDPINTLKKAAKQLDFTFDESFMDTFETSRVTGDSGRSGTDIAPRKRRELSDKMRKEIKQSRHFKEVAKKFKYN